MKKITPKKKVKVRTGITPKRKVTPSKPKGGK